MKREFLEKINLEGGAKLPKEVIDHIRGENGKDIEAAKATITAERDNLKDQLNTVQQSLKQFEGVDVKELQGKITTLQNDLQQKDTEYQTKIADLGFSAMLTEAISAAKGKSSKAITAMLDTDSLKASKNQREDITAALDKLKESDPYLFGSGETKSVAKVSTGGAHNGDGGASESVNTQMNDIIRGAVRPE